MQINVILRYLLPEMCHQETFLIHCWIHLEEQDLESENKSAEDVRFFPQKVKRTTSVLPVYY